jgi:hypothetical protein
MMIIGLKVFSGMNALVPMLISDVRKPPNALQYDRVIDIPHTQSVSYVFLEQYAPPTSGANSY